MKITFNLSKSKSKESNVDKKFEKAWKEHKISADEKDVTLEIRLGDAEKDEKNSPLQALVETFLPHYKQITTLELSGFHVSELQQVTMTLAADANYGAPRCLAHVQKLIINDLIDEPSEEQRNEICKNLENVGLSEIVFDKPQDRATARFVSNLTLALEDYGTKITVKKGMNSSLPLPNFSPLPQPALPAVTLAGLGNQPPAQNAVAMQEDAPQAGLQLAP